MEAKGGCGRRNEVKGKIAQPRVMRDLVNGLYGNNGVYCCQGFNGASEATGS